MMSTGVLRVLGTTDTPPARSQASMVVREGMSVMVVFSELAKITMDIVGVATFCF